MAVSGLVSSWPLGDVPARRRSARTFATVGIAGVAVATLIIAALHVLPPTDAANPMSRTISEYSLYSDGWAFDAGVLILAAASALVGMALTRAGLARTSSWGMALFGLWCVGLVGLIVFPKHGFGADTSLAGRVHWTWTLTAFFSLPVGAALLCWRRGLGLAPGRLPRWVAVLSLAAGGWFLVLAGQTVLGAVTTVQSWRTVGLVERALSLTEMATVVLLACWVLGVTRSGESTA